MTSYTRVIDRFEKEHASLTEVWKHIDVKAQAMAVVAGIIFAALSLLVRMDIVDDLKAPVAQLIFADAVFLMLSVLFAVLTQLVRRLWGPLAGRTAAAVWGEYQADEAPEVTGLRVRTEVYFWTCLNERMLRALGVKGALLSTAQWFVLLGAIGVVFTVFLSTRDVL